MQRLLRSDDCWLWYRGAKHWLKGSESFSRNGSHSSCLTVYILENGVRILPVHFAHGLVKLPESWIKWNMRVCYPPSLITELMYLESPIFKMIKKDDIWNAGAVVELPF